MFLSSTCEPLDPGCCYQPGLKKHTYPIYSPPPGHVQHSVSTHCSSFWQHTGSREHSVKAEGEPSPRQRHLWATSGKTSLMICDRFKRLHIIRDVLSDGCRSSEMSCHGHLAWLEMTITWSFGLKLRDVQGFDFLRCLSLYYIFS